MGLQHWLQTPPGRYALAWEQAQIDRVVSDIFGYHALQLGNPALQGLSHNRMPHRWLALDDAEQVRLDLPGVRPACLLPEHYGGEPVYAEPGLVDAVGVAAESAQQPPEPVPADPHAIHVEHLQCDFTALPFPAQSLDLVVLPHTLEWVDDPHACLREVDRVLMPGGQVVISGFNTWSLWGVRQQFGRVGGGWYLPQHGEFLAPRRVRDWLRLLSFEVTQGRFGCYRPALCSPLWLHRWRFMDKAGDRWWPVFGAVYFLAAIKRVPAMRLVGKVHMRTKRRAVALQPVAQRRAKTE
ncbi:MAG: class I SAM-dependent methyltransferase [Thiomonas sp.]